MKMFLLGMLVMWILLSVVFFLLDCFKLGLWECDKYYLSRLFLPLLIVSATYETIQGMVGVVKVIDLVIKYKINPFKTSIMEIGRKLTKEDKEIFIKRIAGKDENLARNWRGALELEIPMRKK